MAAKLLGPAKASSEDQSTDSEPSTEVNADWQSVLLELTGLDMRRCPRCGQMAMTREPLPDTRAPPTAEAA